MTVEHKDRRSDRLEDEVLKELKSLEKLYSAHGTHDQVVDQQILIELGGLERRFDAHLNVYAANGKESKRVADILELMLVHSAERDIKVDTMYVKFMDDKAVKTADERRMRNIIMYGGVISAIAIIVAAAKVILTG